MNARATWLHLSIAWALAAGCGTIDNSPLRQGVVRGRVEGASLGLSLVTVFGQPGLRDDPGEDGSFEISGVPAGPIELLVLASSTQAARVGVEVLGGQVVDVGTVASEAAAF
ncbi:MAG: carboxypeptidase regulatory-like domain-containing protein, partial [Myxococcaceae bacterium]